MEDKQTAMPGGNQQLQIEYPTPRGNQLQDLKDLRLGDHYCRWILVVLDFYINQQRGFWDLTHKELMSACELSRSVYYARIRKLKELCLISVDDLENSTKKRFRIIRSNVTEIACHHRHAGTKATGFRLVRTEKNRPISGRPVHQEDKSVHNTDRSVLLADKSVHNTDGTILLNSTVKTATTATSPKEVTAADVILRMVECGVDHPTAAVEQALSRGCVPCELMEIVKKFTELSKLHGFQAGALQRRVSSHLPGLTLDAGWPRVKAQAAAPKVDLESDFGSLLDAQREPELSDLIRRHGTDTMRRIMELTSAMSIARSTQWRPRLLQILQRLREGEI